MISSPIAFFISTEAHSSKGESPYRYSAHFTVALPLDVSEEDNSLSSPGPLSPPTNNKRIDSYFTPKEVIRTDSKSSISRNLFGAKALHDTRSSQGLEILPSPAQSMEHGFSAEADSTPPIDLASQPTMLDRSKDVHSLLLSKDTRIKELEHVVIEQSVDE